jgi:hypothetical protein
VNALIGLIRVGDAKVGVKKRIGGRGRLVRGRPFRLTAHDVCGGFKDERDGRRVEIFPSESENYS